MEQWLNDLFTSHGPMVLYCLVIFTLVLAGAGVPFPEEGIFLAAGFAGALPSIQADVFWLCMAGLIGIALGDSLPYFLGRRYGLAVLGKWPFCKLLKPSHIEKTKGFFDKHGSHTIFVARFLAGVRMPTFFMAGAMGVTYFRFMLNDMLGALISCPTSIVLAYYFGPAAKRMLEQSHGVLIGLLVCVAAFVIYKIWTRKKSDSPEDSPVASISEVQTEVPHAVSKAEPAKVRE